MPRSPSFQSFDHAHSSGSVQVTKPTGLAVGDLMIAHVRWVSASGGNNINVPSGWTSFNSTNGGNLTSTIMYKIADASDVAASFFTFSDTNGSSKSVAVSRISDPYTTTPLDQFHGTGANSGSSLTDTGITPTLANDLMLIFITSDSTVAGARTASGYAVATTDPPWTEAYDVNNGADEAIAMAYGVRDPKTATGNVTATLSGDTAGNIIQIINLPVTPMSVLASAFAFPSHVAGIVPPNFFNTFTLFTPSLPDVINWSEPSKTASTWAKPSKSSSTWSTGSKSSTTFTNQNKSL